MGGDKTLYSLHCESIVTTLSTAQLLPLLHTRRVYKVSPPCPAQVRCVLPGQTRAHLGSRVTSAVDRSVTTIAKSVLWQGKGTREHAWRGVCPMSQTSHRKSSFQIGAPPSSPGLGWCRGEQPGSNRWPAAGPRNISQEPSLHYQQQYHRGPGADTAAVVTPSRLLDIHIQLQRYYR